jgi:hypothetical protein
MRLAVTVRRHGKAFVRLKIALESLLLVIPAQAGIQCRYRWVVVTEPEYAREN